MGNKLFKKAVATIALTAMLLQTGYQDFSMVRTVYAAEEDNGIEVIPLQEDNAIEVIQPEETVIDDDIEFVAENEEEIAETEVSEQEDSDVVESAADETDETIESEEELPADDAEELISDDSETVLPESKEAFDDKVVVTGVEYISLHIVTGQMNIDDSFFLDIKGPKSLEYNNILDGRMDKSDQNTYNIDGIGKGKLTIEADIADEMSCEYSVLDNGDIQIEVISAEDPIPEKSIDVHETYVSGAGYDEITLNLDTEQIEDDVYFSAVVEADETASYDGATISDNTIPSLSNRTNSITISDLNKNYFMIKLVGETVDDIVADYSVVSDENGTLEAVVYEGEKEDESSKRVYVYEDEKVSVTATLDFPEAIPDDADFIVTEMTPSSEYNYDAYMQALNNNADSILRDDSEETDEEADKFNSRNTILYDIAFYAYDEDGNYVEIQPEEGTVKIEFVFKREQLKNDIAASENSEINIIHMPLNDSVKENTVSTADAGDISASDINVEVVNARSDVEAESVSFRLSDFSGVAVNAEGHYIKIDPGKDETFQTVLGNAANYGIVANEMTIVEHLESNFAAGILYADNKNVNSCRNNGGSAGVTYIGEYYGSGFKLSKNGNSSSVYIYTTPEAYAKMGKGMWDEETSGNNVVDTTSYTKEQIQSFVSSMVTTAQNKSLAIAAEAAVNGYDFDKVADAPYTGNAADKYLVDLTTLGTSSTGTYYINFPKDRYAKVGHIYFKINKGQKIVLNIPDNSVGFRQYTVEIDGTPYTTNGNADEDIVSQSVIFNCPNATTAYTAGPVDGVFMVPFATDFSTKAVAGGWVIAKTITAIGGQEWHCLWHDMPKPNPCEISITAVKTVNNAAPLSDEKFTFTLESYDWDTKQYTVIDTAINNGSSVMFKPISFTKAGTYAYKVSEAAIDANTGYTYDSNYYVVCYDVKEDSGTKKLSASIRWLKKNNTDWLDKNLNEIKFNNTVTTTPAEYEFKVKKSFEDDNWPDGTTYTFVIEKFTPAAGDGNWVYTGEEHMPEKTEVTVTESNPTGSFGKVYFDPDTVNGRACDSSIPNGVKCKCFMYKITEKIGSVDGVTYDTRYQIIKLWVNTVRVNGRTIAVVTDKLSFNNISCVENNFKPLEFVNKYVAKANIDLLKIDGTSNKALSGVEFGLYDSNNNAVKVTGSAGAYSVDSTSSNIKLLTGSNGRISVSGLVEGSYYFKELSTPAGYQDQKNATFAFTVDKKGKIENTSTANASLFTFSPAAGKSNAVYTVKNKRLENGEVYIKKLDSVTDKPMAGVVFKLYRNGSTTVYRTLTTNASGEASAKDLEWGSYVLKEDSVAGYVANTTEYKFTIDATNRSKSFTGSDAIKNTPIAGGFKLVKKADGKALAGAVFGIKFKGGSKDGQKITCVDNGNGSYTYSTVGTVTQFTTNASGEVNVTNLPYGDYEVVELSSPVGYVATSTAANFSIKNNGDVPSAQVDNDKVQAAAQFVKLDATDESKLAGVVFELYDDAAPTVVKNTATSDANGLVKFEGLGVGNYTIKEKVPSDYVDGGLAIKFTVTNDDNKQTIFLNKDGRVAKETDAKIDNTRKSGSAKLLKKSDKGVVLSGVEFNLYTEAGKLVKVTGSSSPYAYNGTAVVDSNLIHSPMVTGADGVIEVTNLPWGKYYFEEVSVGDSNPSIKPVDSSNKPTYAIEIKKGKLTDTTHFDAPIVNDTVEGYVKLIKEDNDDSDNKLEGVTFTLYKADKTTKVADNLVLTTNGAGEIVYGPLEYGTYYFQEIATVDGYKYSNAFLQVVVDEESTASTVKANATVTAKNERELGSIKLTKKDSTTGNGIAGAQFILQSTNNSGVVKAIQSIFSRDGYVQYGNTTYTTDANGIIFVDNLPWGMYRFKEVKAPEGYTLPEGNGIYSDEKYIGVNNKTATLHAVVTDMENDQIRGKIKLVKSASDDAKKKLNGGSFLLYNATGVYNNGQTYSLTDGEIVIDNLPFGSYYFYEVEAPEGYVLPSTDAARKSTVAVLSSTNAEASVKAPIVAELSNDIITGGFELHKVDATAAKNPLAGATFKLFDANGKVVQVTGSAGTYVYATAKSGSTVEIMDTTAGGVLTVTGLPYGEYAIQEITAPAGYQVKSGTVGISITSNGVVTEFDFENSLIQAKATFTKADFDTKEALEGASFKLYKETTSVDEAGKTVTTATDFGSVSSVKGVFTTADLGAGRYYVQETATPAGYITKLDKDGNAKKYYFTIDASVNGQVIGLESPDLKTNGVSYILNEKKKGTAKLHKVGSDAAHQDGLEGAEFALYMKGSNRQYSVYGGTLTSDKDGYVIATNLPWGDYYFKETKAPTGYDLDTKEYHFTIDETKDNRSGETIEVVLSDTAVNTLILGQAQLTKKGYTANGLKKEDIKALEGAEFALYYDDGAATPNKVEGYTVLVSNDKGLVTTRKDLPVGDYYFVETKAPTGYTADFTTHYTFSVTAENYKSVITPETNNDGVVYNERIKGDVVLFKYETVNGEKVGLAGAKFKLYMKQTIGSKQIKSADSDGLYASDANGLVSATGLEWGEYYFVEEVAPTGFELDNTQISFEITAADHHIEKNASGEYRCSLGNDRKEGSLKLVKTDRASGSKLAGATFELHKKVGSTDTVVGTYTTDKNGEISVDKLDWATYYFLETAAPTGYVLPTGDAAKTAEVIISASNVSDTVEVSMANDLVFGNVQITKTDDATPVANKLAGAKFSLYKKDVTEDAEGKSQVSKTKVNVTKTSDGIYAYSETATTVEMITPANGTIKVTGLPFGTYVFVEDEAPTGFVKTDEEFEVKVTVNQSASDDPVDKVAVKTCVNSTLSAGAVLYKAYKVNASDDATALEGATFDLYRVENGAETIVKSATSDENGIVRFTGIGEGSYIVKESATTPNNAYIPSGEELSFTVTHSDDGKVFELNTAADPIINTAKKGSAKITKYYREGQKTGELAGVTFDLFKGTKNADGTITYDTVRTAYDVTGNDGVANFENLSWGYYAIKENKTNLPAGITGIADADNLFAFEINAENCTSVQTFTAYNDRQEGSLELEKVDNNGDALTGGTTRFLLKGTGTDNSDYSKEIVVPKTGKAVVNGLLWGSYSLTEIEAETGYVKDDTVRTFTIDGSNLKQTYTGDDAVVNDRIKGSVKLVKVNKVTKNPISNVKFELFNVTANYQVVNPDDNDGYWVTNESGYLEVTDLEYGEYRFSEAATEGYETIPDFSFKIETDGQVVDFTDSKHWIENTPKKGSVKLIKSINDTTTPIEGATFSLYRTSPLSATEQVFKKDGVYVSTSTTDENGEIVINNLEWGTYYFVEQDKDGNDGAPLGYASTEASGKRYEFEINAANSEKTISYTINAYNDKLKGSVELTKIDPTKATTSSDRYLEGAEFSLYKVDEEGKGEDITSGLPEARNDKNLLVTNADGKVTVNNLEWGTYYFIEEKAPEGYECVYEGGQKKKYFFTIDESNCNAKTHLMETQQVEVSNNEVFGYISIQKRLVNPDGSLDTTVTDLSGIKFEILDSEKNAVVTELITNAAGKVTAGQIGKLRYGTYYISEVLVPKALVDLGYVKNTSPVKVEITASNTEEDANTNAAYTYQFDNSSILGAVKLKKVDASTGKPIEGMLFNLYSGVSPAGTLVTTLTTDEAGNASVEGLVVGKYYVQEDEDSAKSLGYVYSDAVYSFEITKDYNRTIVKNSNGSEQINWIYYDLGTISNTPEKGSISLEKWSVDSAGTRKKLLLTSGSTARFELYKVNASGDDELIMDEDAIAALYNESGVVTIDNLEWGSYYFVETVAPAGYILPDEPNNRTNTVVVNGASIAKATVNKATIDDETIKVKVSKVEIGGSEELPGALMQVYKADAIGNIVKGSAPVASWTSTNKPHLLEIGSGFEGLKPGITYVLHEDLAPAGYSLTKDIVFKVDNKGKVTTSARVDNPSTGVSTIYVEDRKIQLSIDKHALGTDTVLAGAVLSLEKVMTDGQDNVVVDTWTTTLNPHLVNITFTAGESYILRETKAPAGYYTADPVTIKIKDDGGVEIINDASAKAVVTKTTTEIDKVTIITGNKLTMVDKPIKLVVSKSRLTGSVDENGNPVDYVKGATLNMYKLDKDGKEITPAVYSWVSSGADDEIPYGKLEVGATYVIKEDASKLPAGYVVADPVKFTVKDYNPDDKTDKTGLVAQKVRVTDGLVEAKFSKRVYGDTSGNELAGATLSLYDSDNNLMATWTTNDKPFVVTSVKEGNLSKQETEMYKNYNVIYGVDLEVGKTYRLVEDEAPYGYAKAADITFTIGTNGLPTNSGEDVVNGTVIMRDKVDEELYTHLDGKKIWLLYCDEEGNVIPNMTYSDVTIRLTQRLKDSDKSTASTEIDLNGDGVADDEFYIKIKNGSQYSGGVETSGDGVSYKEGAKGTVEFTFGIKNGKNILPKKDRNGNEYVYEVKEEGDGKYDPEINIASMNAVIKNIPIVDPFKISGTKKWKAPSDKINTEGITIVLYRDGEIFKTTTLDKDGNFEFDKLWEFNFGKGEKEDPATADGHKFKYEIVEEGADGFVLEVDFNGVKQTVYPAVVPSPTKGVVNVTLTNRIKPEYVRFNGTKKWNTTAGSSKNPEITIELRSGDPNGKSELVDSRTLPNTTTTYTFGYDGQKKLPKYDEEGQVINYFIKEIVPEGYYEPVYTKSVNGNDTTVNIENTPTKIIVHKKDAVTGGELAGAKMSVRINDTKGQVVDSWTSTSTAHNIEGLIVGQKYVLIEDSAPSGYVIASPVTFTVTGEANQSVEMLDPRAIGEVTLTKRDAETRALLAGAEFELYTSSNARVSAVGTTGSYEYSTTGTTRTFVVGSDGTLKISKLPYGEYYFKETKAPEGYELSTESHYFTLSSSSGTTGATASVTVDNTKRRGRARLAKISGGDGSALAGATFELYSKTARTPGQAVGGTFYNNVYYLYGTYTTDATGSISVTDLPWDDYYFIETIAPDGHVLNLDTNGDPLVYTFTVDGKTSTSVSIDLGFITNPTGGGGGGAVGGTTGGGAGGGVAGVRRLNGSGVSGVLGVRSAPTSGVLGVRVGPTTGDTSTIALWLILLLASISVITAILISAGKRRKNK